MKIKTGDNVKVLSGKDRGKTGKVIQVLYRKDRNQYYAVVEGINMLKKHMRGKREEKGQIIELPAPLHLSNVMLVDPKIHKSSRIGFKIEGKDKKRISKKSGEFID
ncbi:MAG: 50S ribosomal protein L24 [Candidatus Magasanikbacteria bacterium]|nr:50S ribosomal protein L24 [Candidatus Magasanikbacteria bacterium]